mmetsp:Transcript_36978/g.48686  ORF Transcript_36978/g.48686 Transcript_36978/m.48686 type:complete len:211 (-) Transcript_36978:253-885(-)
MLPPILIIFKDFIFISHVMCFKDPSFFFLFLLFVRFLCLGYVKIYWTFAWVHHRKIRCIDDTKLRDGVQPVFPVHYAFLPHLTGETHFIGMQLPRRSTDVTEGDSLPRLFSRIWSGPIIDPTRMGRAVPNFKGTVAQNFVAGSYISIQVNWIIGVPMSVGHVHLISRCKLKHAVGVLNWEQRAPEGNKVGRVNRYLARITLPIAFFQGLI